MDSINIRKLAEELNLSVSTISKAFRNSYDINAATKERILEKARELNYQPNPLASSLRTQKSRTIAVVVPEIANTFFSLAINGIESVAGEKEFHVLIYLTHEDYARELGFIRHLQNGRVDGVLISVSGGDADYEHLDQLRAKGIPVVFFDRVYYNSNTTKVTTNNFESSLMATRHLIRQGCKKIAHLYHSSSLSITKERKEGYLEALRQAKMPVREELMVECDSDQAKSLQLIRKMLKKQGPDGVFSSFEKLAVLCYQACAAQGIKIPGDLKILTFSNLESAALMDPPLTTITQPAYEIGRQAASVLFKALEKKSAVIANEHIIVPSVLVERKSTKK
jgi:LacI family transcriptional regulator